MGLYPEDDYRLQRGKANANSFDLLRWLKENKPEQNYFHLAELIFEIHSKTRRKPEFIASEIVRFYTENRLKIEMELIFTSEIFITGGQTRGGRVQKRRLRFYPMHRGCWCSHLRINN